MHFLILKLVLKSFIVLKKKKKDSVQFDFSIVISPLSFGMTVFGVTIFYCIS